MISRASHIAGDLSQCNTAERANLLQGYIRGCKLTANLATLVTAIVMYPQHSLEIKKFFEIVTRK